MISLYYSGLAARIHLCNTQRANPGNDYPGLPRAQLPDGGHRVEFTASFDAKDREAIAAYRKDFPDAFLMGNIEGFDLL